MNPKKLNALKILNKELERLKSEPIYTCGVTVGAINNDPFHWNITMIGPNNTPYEKGFFKIIADFPDDYPQKGPKMRFINKMYHCNISDQGDICISTLTKWKPGSNMNEVLPLIFALFFMQNPDDPYDFKKANLYKTNKAEFDKIARQYTQNYANINSI